MQWKVLLKLCRETDPCHCLPQSANQIIGSPEAMAIIVLKIKRVFVTFKHLKIQAVWRKTTPNTKPNNKPTTKLFAALCRCLMTTSCRGKERQLPGY